MNILKFLIVCPAISRKQANQSFTILWEGGGGSLVSRAPSCQGHQTSELNTFYKKRPQLKAYNPKN